MPSASNRARPARPLWQTALGVIVLAGFGAATGIGMAHMTALATASWADTLVWAMVAATLGTAALSAMALFARPNSLPRGCGVLQIGVMTLAGLMLALPMVATRSVGADVVFIAVLVLLALQVVANLMLWRRADEMLRRILTETSVMAFWALQTALFVYAAGERLGVISGVSAWGMLGVLMGVYFIASIVAAARRGIH
ncbi:hypothetical protein BH10PSE2_BH10PSE2_21120 [soil metagenome]